MMFYMCYDSDVTRRVGSLQGTHSGQCRTLAANAAHHFKPRTSVKFKWLTLWKGHSQPHPFSKSEKKHRFEFLDPFPASMPNFAKFEHVWSNPYSGLFRVEGEALPAWIPSGIQILYPSRGRDNGFGGKREFQNFKNENLQRHLEDNNAPATKPYT